MNSVKESGQIPFTTAAIPVEDFDSQSDIPAPSLGEGRSTRTEPAGDLGGKGYAVKE
jgi:hypothetical protein